MFPKLGVESMGETLPYEGLRTTEVEMALCLVEQVPNEHESQGERRVDVRSSIRSQKLQSSRQTKAAAVEKLCETRLSCHTGAGSPHKTGPWGLQTPPPPVMLRINGEE